MTTHICYQGLIHSFLGMDRLFDEAKPATDDIGAFLQKEVK